MSESVDKKVEEEIKPSMVLFTDGSARPNPGFRGYGVHGYLHTNKEPKTGAGNTTHYPTALGYVQKLKKKHYESLNSPLAVEVGIINYIDVFESCKINGTNNLSELEAVIKAMEIASTYEIASLEIYMDSEYVRKGLTEWSRSWVANNWRKSDGGVVANAEAWKKLLFVFDALRGRTEVKLSWVKGHLDNLGNIIADKLAMIGSLNACRGLYKLQELKTEPKGYWRHDVDKNPLMASRRLYFNSMSEYNKPGVYYIGDHGKEDAYIGKASTDSTYAIVKLNTPEVMVEQMRDVVCKLAEQRNSIVLMLLDELFHQVTYKELVSFGECAYVQESPGSLTLQSLSNNPICKEVFPPIIASRAIDVIGTLETMLDNIEANTLSADTKVKDITDLFYGLDEKGKNKFSKDHPVGTTLIKTNLEVGDKVRDLRLVMGVDMPDRNALKNMEDFNPSVKLVCWPSSPDLYRFAIYVSTDTGKGVYCGAHANTIIL